MVREAGKAKGRVRVAGVVERGEGLDRQPDGPFDRFLPGGVETALDFQLGHDVEKIGVVGRGQFPQRRGEGADVALHRMEKTDSHLERGGRRALDQALGLHRARLRAILGEAVGLGINAAEGEALAVFFRGGAVGIKNVAFVKDGMDDGIDEFLVHGATSAFSSAGRSCSMVCSQVGRPWSRR